MSTLDAGNPDGEDETQKASRLAARAARFNKSAPGKRNKELEDARAKERQAFEAQGLINSGKTELSSAVEMRGTCEQMCSRFEMETRNTRMEVHPFEKGPDDKLDPQKAVAAYTRSDAGAGHGTSAILPSDLRTPATLVRTLDYLFSKIMPLPPTNTSSKSVNRKALGHSAGFIRDRTRAIRKEFAMQNSWGHAESIESHERIARWHILCLRELQEETGFNSDMHIDSAELGRCFTSLRQFYNDQREVTGLEVPCPNEPEMRAYMLIFDLTHKSVSIPTSELPSVILDDPLVKLAWEIRKAAQRNFDSQKDASKHNAELGSNLITRFTKLLKQRNVPFLLSCMVEVRLRDMRRSALRALTRTYPRLKTDPIRVNEDGQVVERKMVLLETLNRILGCEEQDDEETAWQDVIPSSRDRDDEAVDVVSRFELEVWPDKSEAVGSLINLGAVFNDNEDAPFTRRWRLITAKRDGVSLVDIVNGRAGVLMPTGSSSKTRPVTAPKRLNGNAPAFSFAKPAPAPLPSAIGPRVPPSTNGSAFSFSFAKPTPLPAVEPTQATVEVAPAAPTPAPVSRPNPSAKKVTFAPTPALSPMPTPPAPSPQPLPSFSFKPGPSSQSSTPAASKMPDFFPSPSESARQPTPPAAPSARHEPPTAPAVQPVITTPTAPTKSDALLTPTAKPARRSPTLTEEQRRAQRRALPALRDKLIAEVVADKLSGIEPELAAVVKRHRAARAHAEAKARRQEMIAKFAQQTYDALLDRVIEATVAEARFSTFYLRARVRAIGLGWRDWAISRRQDRQAAAREREEAFVRLGSMGLGSSSFSAPDFNGPFSSSTSTSHGVHSHHTERLDPFAADVMLHQTERSKDQFYSSATFLTTTARFVHPHLHAISPTSTTFTFESAPAPQPEYFRTLISPSKDSATPSSSKAFEWLRSKIFPVDDTYEHEGTAFDAEVMGRYDDLSTSDSIGLLVFEAPLQSWSSDKTRSNAADAQDRITQLHELASNQANEYSPALLVVTWQGETLAEASERLGITDALSSFARVASLSLESAEDLDERFAGVLEHLLAESPTRIQAIIDLQDVDYLSTCFSTGIDALNESTRIIQSALGDVEISETSTFDPPVLPPFHLDRDDARTLSHLSERIAEYLQDDMLGEFSDASLFVAPLRQAAFHSRPLPLDGILQSLAVTVFSDISSEKLPVRAFFPVQSGVDDFISEYLTRVRSSYANSVEQHIAELARTLPPLAVAPVYEPATPPKDGRALKRSHSKVSLANDENRSPRERTASETKAMRNAKLLKALRDVEQTLCSLEVEHFSSEAVY